jgi:beta-xylosidase
MTDKDWVRFKTGKQAVNRQPVPFEGSVQKKVSDFKDDFSGETLKVDWTWNYPFAEIDVTMNDGELILTGRPIAGTNTGQPFVCVRKQHTIAIRQKSVISMIVSKG